MLDLLVTATRTSNREIRQESFYTHLVVFKEILGWVMYPALQFLGFLAALRHLIICTSNTHQHTEVAEKVRAGDKRFHISNCKHPTEGAS